MTKEDLLERLQADLTALSNNRHKEGKSFWYEVFIDLDEQFDGIYPYIKDMPYQVAFDTCLGYLYRMDAYYYSPQYYEDLNKMIATIDD